MNEESPAEAQAAPDSSASSDTTPSSPSRGKLPAFVPYVLLAVIPAVIVGLLVLFFAGSGDSDDGPAAGILEAFLVPAEDSNTVVESVKGALPAEFPEGFPAFEGVETVASFAVTTPQSQTFRLILTSSSPSQEVFAFYQRELDTDPWQVEVGQIGSIVTGLQFTRPDNPDVSGVVIVNQTKLEEDTIIQVVYEDLGAALTPGTGPTVPLIEQSRPLPPGFPETVPVFAGSEDSIIIDSGFQRGQGGQFFAVTFLTLDSQDDVIDFYKDEFDAQGWNVADSTSTDTTSFALGIEFDDGEDTVSGQIVADTYEEDANYTRVDMIVQVSGRTN